MTFKIDMTALADTLGGIPEVREEDAQAAQHEILRQLRADPRGKDLPEDPSEALDVLLAGSAALAAAKEEMPSVVDVLAELDVVVDESGDVIRDAHAVLDLFRPLVARLRGNVDVLEASLAEARAERDEARRVEEIAKSEARIALRQRDEERERSEKQRVLLGTALQGGDANIKALVARIADLESGQGTTYTVGDQNALALALAFLDDALKDADMPRIPRKTLPPLGTAGWATAWLGQVTLARLAAARVQPVEVQRRIHVAATELERVLFALFDRAVPMAEEAPPSPKGGRRAAT